MYASSNRCRQTATALILLLATAFPARGQTGTYALDVYRGSVTSLSLAAGDYFLQATGGGWNAWGIVGGCNASGANCSEGYLNFFTYVLNGGPPQSVSNGRWATPSLAIANAPSGSITVSSSSTLELYISDSYFADNIGSLDVTVSAVTATPEPASLVLLATGFSALAGAARSRRRSRG